MNLLTYQIFKTCATNIQATPKSPLRKAKCKSHLGKKHTENIQRQINKIPRHFLREQIQRKYERFVSLQCTLPCLQLTFYTFLGVTQNRH